MCVWPRWSQASLERITKPNYLIKDTLMSDILYTVNGIARTDDQQGKGASRRLRRVSKILYQPLSMVVTKSLQLSLLKTMSFGNF